MPSTGLSIYLNYKSTRKSHSDLLLSDIWKLHRSTESWIFPVLFCLFVPLVLFFINWPFALQVYPNHPSRVFPINARMIDLLYNFCNSSVFLFSCIFVSQLKCWPYMIRSIFIKKLYIFSHHLLLTTTSHLHSSLSVTNSNGRSVTLKYMLTTLILRI